MILGKVKFHKDLAEDVKKVKGGGLFTFKAETKTFIFSGESHDFGSAKFEDIKKAVEEGKVFDTLKCRNITDRYGFSYNTNTEIIILK